MKNLKTIICENLNFRMSKHDKLDVSFMILSVLQKHARNIFCSIAADQPVFDIELALTEKDIQERMDMEPEIITAQIRMLVKENHIQKILEDVEPFYLLSEKELSLFQRGNFHKRKEKIIKFNRN